MSRTTVRGPAARALAVGLRLACAAVLAASAARAAAAPTCSAPRQRIATLDAPAPAPGSCPFLPPATATWPPEWNVNPEPLQVGDTVAWELPAGMIGMTVTLEVVQAVPEVPFVIQGKQAPAPNSALPVRLVAPGSRSWWDIDLGARESFVAARGTRAAVGSLQIPNTSPALQTLAEGGLPAGRWQLTVGDLAFSCAAIPSYGPFCGSAAGITPPPDLDAYRAGQYNVLVQVRRGPIPDQGTIDLAFYLHRSFDDRPLRATEAQDDPDLQRVVASLGDFLGRAGLCVGEVTWIDLPEWAQERWAGGVNLETKCEGSTEELFTLGGAGARVNVFMLPSVTMVKEPILGYTSTVPGTPGLSNTIHSGLVVTAEDLRTTKGCSPDVLPSACGPDAVAMIVAHETGHFLGLFHPTERNGDRFDPLDDTPTCECLACATGEEHARCADGSALLLNSDCDGSGATCGGARNLMFWSLWIDEGAPPVGDLTPEQATVIRANPLVNWPPSPVAGRQPP